jgi:NTE family protein
MSILFRTFSIMQDIITRTRLETDGADIVIEPQIGNIEPYQLHRATEAIEEGVKATEQLIPHILDLIERKKNNLKK